MTTHARDNDHAGSGMAAPCARHADRPLLLDEDTAAALFPACAVIPIAPVTDDGNDRGYRDDLSRRIPALRAQAQQAATLAAALVWVQAAAEVRRLYPAPAPDHGVVDAE